MKYNNSTAVIYGAQAIAYSVYKVLNIRKISVLFYVVSDKKDNPDTIGNINVITLYEYFEWRKNNSIKHDIYIAAPENMEEEMCSALVQNGCNNIICVDSVEFGRIMDEYYTENGSFISVNSFRPHNMNPKLETVNNICVYQAKHENDRALKKTYENPSWLREIQVGTASAEDYYDNMLHDNVGGNISAQNRIFAELTALYWAWKNSEADVIGLAHYRRLLDINESDIFLLLNNEIDVILPYPMFYYPNADAHHKRWVRDDDWNVIMKAVKELYPDYYEVSKEVFSKEYFYNYNLLCARRSVIDDYCKWLFNIFELAQSYIGSKEPENVYKYFGYAGESMCNLFFMYNKNRYRKAHTTALMRV